MVGCVIERDGVVVGEGSHRRQGEDHAEILALREAGDAARGATVWVNLEPCCHWGRTPPCTDALLRAGVARVVFGMVDPDPRVAGRGAADLRAAGVEVLGPLLTEESERLNEVYVTRIRHGRPFITLKIATSLDGRTATRTGESQWITGPASRGHARRERARAGAVAVGVETVLADDPALTARTRGLPEPARVILDSSLRTPTSGRLWEGGGPILIATTAAAAARRRTALEGRGAEVIVCGDGARVDLHALGDALLLRGHHHLFVEGGATVLGAFVDARWADRLLLYQAPILLGGARARPAIAGEGVERITTALGLHDLVRRRLGPDMLLEGRISCSPAS
jgi:diaminohydroxyphosphoribosylaminopyrimidine deaminase/5-amino-6-(5-phosphoribosylamino)uracil reductase